MALLAAVGRKNWKGRLFILVIYTILVLLGTTMVVPFMITISNSTTNNYDYDRFRPVPRYLYSQNDRYLKGLVYYFNGFRGSITQMKKYFPEIPAYWSGWQAIGRDIENDDKFSQNCLDSFRKNESKNRLAAADYAEFLMDYPLSDTMVTVLDPQATRFLEKRYIDKLVRLKPEYRKKSYSERRSAALDLISEEWELPYETFYSVSFSTEQYAPVGFQSYIPVTDTPKYQDYLSLKEYYRGHYFTPGVKALWFKFLKEKGVTYAAKDLVFPVTKESAQEIRKLWREFCPKYAPASPCIPYALRSSWTSYLRSDRAAAILNLKPGKTFAVADYNRMAKTKFNNLNEIPFPLPAETGGELRNAWNDFRMNSWPLRLTTIRVTPESQKLYEAFLKKNIKHLRVMNQLFGTKNTSWSQFRLTARPSTGNTEFERNRCGIWKNFAAQIPLRFREQTCSEIAYQKFVLKKYGSLKKINEVYGWDLKSIEYAFPPFRLAYTVTFLNNETAFTTNPIFDNYRVIASYLLLNSNAVWVTFVLVAFAILCTLIINPLAAYALSRFRIRGKELIILFMLATMAFPAMVSAIPAYLLMRDLGMLNTFAALILPGAANGMAIFILKGFFDSLPPELFEAATIDGANEFQIFRIVAMPMVKPILAINCLNAFIGAYNGWEWALIICQKKSMWTLAVWMYQATTWWDYMPWIISAGFVVTSIPTFIIFVSCQKMILKGIVIPSMK